MKTFWKKLFLIVGISGILLACSKNVDKQIAEQLELGQRYLMEENYEEAIVIYTKVIELDPKCSEAYIKVAEAYAGLGDYESAVVWLEKGYEITEDGSIQQELQKYNLQISENKVNIKQKARENEEESSVNILKYNSAEDAYDKILDEYREACSVKSDDWRVCQVKCVSFSKNILKR